MKYATDLLLLSGAGVVTYGVWMLDPTAAVITGGAILLAAGLARSRAEAVAEFLKKRGDK